MLELTVSKNECGLHEATATLTIPAITVTRAKADRDDLEYESLAKLQPNNLRMNSDVCS